MVTKTATMRTTEELVRMHVDLFNGNKLEDGAKLVTKDFEWTTVPFDETHHGPKGYVDSNRNWTRAFPDAKVTIDRVIANENTAVVEFHGRGTHKGPLMGPDGKIEATGRKVDLPVVEIYEFQLDKLRRVRSYFDTATLMRQLGLGS